MQTALLAIFIVVMVVFMVFVMSRVRKLGDKADYHLSRAIDNEFLGNEEQTEAHAQDFQASSRKTRKIVYMSLGSLILMVIIYLILLSLFR